MNTLLVEKTRNILKRDSDGQWYAIPEKMVDCFIQLSESIQNSEFMSDEWYEASDEFHNQFGSYMKDEKC